MLAYHIRSSLRSIRRNPVLSLLMVAAIAVGIGVSMTMMTVYYLMSRDPIPDKSEQLFAVQLDSWGPLRPYSQSRPERPPSQVTYRDATALMSAGKAYRQAAMFESSLILQPLGESELPFEVDLRVTHGDFFAMFDVPFQYGGPWDKLAEDDQTHVVVLNQVINNRLFGGEDSVGKKVLLRNQYFTVTGVIDEWEPLPRFYDISGSPFQPVNDIFLPFSLTSPLKLGSAGNTSGWKAEDIKSFEDRLNSEMVWIQYWAELESASEVQAYLDHLDSYVMEQKKLGRFQRPLNNQVHNVVDWLDYHEVVMGDVKVMVALGFLFLLVCMLSSVALLLTKFDGKSTEVSLRRALGASRSAVLGQHLVEIGLIGIIGGLAGIGLTQLSLNAIRGSISQAPQGLFQIDWVMVGAALAVSVCTSVLAGIYPAWRSCLTSPARELKNQ